MKTTYLFRCDNCDHLLSVEMDPRHFKNRKKCPSCKKNKLYQEFGLPFISVRLSETELKTIGHLANRHRDEWSEDKKLEQVHRDEKFLEDREKLEPSIAEDMTGAEAPEPYKKPEKLKEKKKKRRNKVKKIKKRK